LETKNVPKEFKTNQNIFKMLSCIENANINELKIKVENRSTISTTYRVQTQKKTHIIVKSFHSDSKKGQVGNVLLTSGVSLMDVLNT